MIYSDDEVARLYFRSNFSNKYIVGNIAKLTGRTESNVHYCIEKYTRRMSASDLDRIRILSFIKEGIQNHKAKDDIYSDLMNARRLSGYDFNTLYREAVHDMYSSEAFFPEEVLSSIRKDLAHGMNVIDVAAKYDLLNDVYPLLLKIQRRVQFEKTGKVENFTKKYSGLVTLGDSSRTDSDVKTTDEEDCIMSKCGKLEKVDGRWTDASMCRLVECAQKHMREKEMLDYLEIPSDKYNGVKALYRKVKQDLGYSSPRGEKTPITMPKSNFIKRLENGEVEVPEDVHIDLQKEEGTLNSDINDFLRENLSESYNERTDSASSEDVAEDAAEQVEEGTAVAADNLVDYKLNKAKSWDAEIEYLDYQIKACEAEVALLKEIRKTIIEMKENQ